MLSLCCTKIIRERLCLSAQLPSPVQPSTRLGNWYVHLARFGHQQIVIATSERSLLTVLLPARRLRESIEISFQAAVAQLLGALQVPTKIVNRELAAVQPISFAAASSRHVIGSINEFARQIESDLPRIDDPLHLSLRLGETPMSAVGSKANYGLPNEVARDLLMSWEH
jgi:uncharacterized protein DUF6933